MFAFLAVIFILWLFFSITGFAFRIAGKFFGFILDIIGYAVIGILAVSVLGFAIYALPVLLLVGISAAAIGMSRR